MLRNYLKIAFRNFARYRTYSIINVLGLTLSLACSFLILLWVQGEYERNHFHEEIEQIHQVFRNFPDERGNIQTRWACPYPVADALATEFTGIEQAAGFRSVHEVLFTLDQDEDFLMDGAMAHFSLFNIFSFPLLEGAAAIEEDRLDGIFISERLAERYFGADWHGRAIGETIEVDGNDVGQSALQVVGVFKNIPETSTLQFDFITNLRKFAKEHTRWTRWGSSAFETFVLLNSNQDVTELGEQIRGLVAANGGPKQLSLQLQPFADTYLYSQFTNGKPTGGRITYVRIFFFAALFLLLMACINFVNLTTALATRRAKEVGVRKVAGANRKTLIAQFMTEAGLITLFSIGLAVLLCESLLPYVNQLLGQEIAFDFSSSGFWLAMTGISLLVILFAGSYPSFILSSFSVTGALKSNVNKRAGSPMLRKGLVVFQFILSALLLTCTVVVRQQVFFIKNKQLGLDRQHIIQMEIPSGLRTQTASFKEALLQSPHIENTSRIVESPLSIGRATDDFSWPGKDPDSEVRISFLQADQHFLDVFKMSLAGGQFHRREMPDGDTTAIVINETAAALMNLDHPVGSKVMLNETELNVIGVIKDFHASSLHENIGPVIIFNDPSPARHIAIRYQPGQAEQAVAFLESTYRDFVPDYPIQFHFLDQQYEQMYRSELLIGKLSNWFAMVAIFISCLGLLGLGAFMAEQKTKEIGIRKVMGASVASIVWLLSWDFLKLVLFAFLISAPITSYIMRQWLTNFAYHVDIEWWVYAGAGAIAISAAVLTIGIRSMRAALANPMESLRQE